LLTRLLGAAQGSQHSGVGVMDLLAADPGFVRAREPLDGPGRVLQGLLRLALNQERKAGLELRPGMTGAEAAADARGFQSATERSGEIASNPLRPSQRVRELDARRPGSPPCYSLRMVLPTRASSGSRRRTSIDGPTLVLLPADNRVSWPGLLFAMERWMTV
jgi:hypothetical protein